MPMIYKMSEDKDGNKAILVDEKGLPIVIDNDKEDDAGFGIDAIHLLSKVPALQEEAKNHRLKAKETSEKLKVFDGIDPTKATEAMQIAANLTAGDLTKKEEVERIKKETEDAWSGKISELNKVHEIAIKEKETTISNMDLDLRQSLLSNNFAKSPHFSGKEPVTRLTPDIAEAYFGKSFKIETVDGRRKAVGYIGEDVIYSKSKPGTLADFDEAMDRIIDAYPMKDVILHKSTGSGAQGGGGGPRSQTISGSDPEAFGNNLEAIASGKVKVI